MKGRKKGSKDDAWASRTTFWNIQRVKNDYRVKELAETLGLGVKVTGSYLTGFLMPNDKTIEDFCNLFQIDFSKGKGEFYKAHEAYDREKQNRKRRISSKKETECVYPKEEVEKPLAPAPVEKADVPVVNPDEIGDRVMEMLYNKIPYKDFKILAGQIMSGADIVECVYGNVDFDTFAKIVDIVHA